MKQVQSSVYMEDTLHRLGELGVCLLYTSAVLDSRFFMGSMSTAVGDKLTRAIEYAAAKHLPLVIVSASGGARCV